MFKHIRNLVAPVLAAVLAATMAQGAFYQWSKTSASNATADPTINWAEGMSPSSVNDSARAMMARAAEYRDDISGLLATGGTASAYTVTTNQGLATTPDDGQLISFTVHATNSVAATLTADGGNTYPLQTAPASAVPAGVLISGSPYSAKFSSSASAWILRNFYGTPTSIPVGGIIIFSAATSPNSNLVLPYGQCISRTTYATYFAMVSTTYGVCDGTTTFAVPDLRGRTVFGQDGMGGAGNANRLSATATGGINGQAGLGSSGGEQTHFNTQGELPAVAPTFTGIAGTITGAVGSFLSDYSTLYVAGSAAGGVTFNAPQGQSKPSFTPDGTISNLGSGTGANNVPPGIVQNYLLRIN